MAGVTLTRSHLSSEPIRVPVYAEVNGVEVDPTAMVVAMAFVLVGSDPLVGDWTAGTWDVSGVYKAQVKPPVLAVGVYAIWLKLTGTDTPVKKVGYLRLV